jgi:RNA polymerase sigma factor (sigma-70 family)
MIYGSEQPAGDLFPGVNLIPNEEMLAPLSLVPDSAPSGEVYEQLDFDTFADEDTEPEISGWQLKHVIDNLDLVRRIAWRYQGTSYTRLDLEGEGRRGLVWAATHYNPSAGVPFANFASSCIHGAMTDALRDKDRMIRPIRKDSPALARVKDAIADLNDGVNRVHDDEIANYTGMKESDVRHYRDAPRIPYVESIFKPILTMAHGGTMTLLDLLVGEHDHAPAVDTVVDVHNALDTLEPHQGELLRFRWGIRPYDAQGPGTQEEAAEHFAIHFRTVQRREKAARAAFKIAIGEDYFPELPKPEPHLKARPRQLKLTSNPKA